MAGFANYKEYVDACEEGKCFTSSFRKSGSTAMATGVWKDLSGWAGNPSGQFYAATPLAAMTLAQSTDPCIKHGPNVSPSTKYLKSLLAIPLTSYVPCSLILCDYLLFYPFIDESITDPQTLTNTITIPRYTTGEGVQVMAVIQAPHASQFAITLSYTNSAGVASRSTSSLDITNSTTSTVGDILTSQAAGSASRMPFSPFLQLQAGDTGVRSIQTVTISLSEIGLFALVLVKPLAQLNLREATSPVENNYLKDFSHLPVIKDDAYLNFLAVQPTTAGTPGNIMHGMIETVWT